MPLDTVGILSVIDFAPEQVAVVDAVMREYFVNEQPLYSRLPHRKATAETYTIIRYDVRQSAFVVGTGGITNVAAALPFADASPFMVGDVLELDDGTNTERVEVLAAPTLTATPNTVTVRRAREGTAAAAFAAGATVRLIANSRTGAEIDQQAYRPTTTPLQQVVQTFQYPVQVGGKAEAISNVALPPGASSVMGRDKAIKLVDAVREAERAMYYGKGEAPAATGDRGKMKGLRTLIASYNGGANVTTNAGGSYTRQSFLAATVQKIYNAGGMPDTVLCSSDFLGFLDTWVPNKTAQMGNGRTAELGFPITTFVLPLNAQPLTFVPAPQFRPGTAAVLTAADLDVRVLRELYWQPRERRGDAMEGDWIGDLAINMNHPQFHAWVENITSAA